MWTISKSHCEKKKIDIFAINWSSRHEKRCQMSIRLFSLFRGSIYQQCLMILGCFGKKMITWYISQASLYQNSMLIKLCEFSYISILILLHFYFIFFFEITGTIRSNHSWNPDKWICFFNHISLCNLTLPQDIHTYVTKHWIAFA